MSVPTAFLAGLTLAACAAAAAAWYITCRSGRGRLLSTLAKTGLVCAGISIVVCLGFGAGEREMLPAVGSIANIVGFALVPICCAAAVRTFGKLRRTTIAAEREACQRDLAMTAVAAPLCTLVLAGQLVFRIEFLS